MSIIYGINVHRTRAHKILDGQVPTSPSEDDFRYWDLRRRANEAVTAHPWRIDPNNTINGRLRDLRMVPSLGTQRPLTKKLTGENDTYERMRGQSLAAIERNPHNWI